MLSLIDWSPVHLLLLTIRQQSNNGSIELDHSLECSRPNPFSRSRPVLCLSIP